MPSMASFLRSSAHVPLSLSTIPLWVNRTWRTQSKQWRSPCFSTYETDNTGKGTNWKADSWTYLTKSYTPYRYVTVLLTIYVVTVYFHGGRKVTVTVLSTFVVPTVEYNIAISGQRCHILFVLHNLLVNYLAVKQLKNYLRHPIERNTTVDKWGGIVHEWSYLIMYSVHEKKTTEESWRIFSF